MRREGRMKHISRISHHSSKTSTCSSKPAWARAQQLSNYTWMCSSETRDVRGAHLCFRGASAGITISFQLHAPETSRSFRVCVSYAIRASTRSQNPQQNRSISWVKLKFEIHEITFRQPGGRKTVLTIKSTVLGVDLLKC